MDSDRLSEVKKGVSIPAYFYNIIVPQMASYYSDYTVDFDLKPTCKCPIHDESTPSMRYFDETNTFFCYGCRAGGDVIELHRRFNEQLTGELPNFDESVDFLYSYFIKGNDHKHIVNRSGGEAEEFKSEVKDLMRLSGYCTNLERQLLVDNSLSEDVKRKLWNSMDVMNLLVSKNLVNAVDAMKHIKVVVRESVK